VTAEYTRILHDRVEIAQPGPTPADDEVHGLEMEQERRHQPGVNVEQAGRVTAFGVTQVQDFVAAAFERFQDVGVLIGGTGLIDNGNFHGTTPV
jgi:hypothetical protein